MLAYRPRKAYREDSLNSKKSTRVQPSPKSTKALEASFNTKTVQIQVLWSFQEEKNTFHYFKWDPKKGRRKVGKKSECIQRKSNAEVI